MSITRVDHDQRKALVTTLQNQIEIKVLSDSDSDSEIMRSFWGVQLVHCSRRRCAVGGVEAVNGIMLTYGARLWGDEGETRL